MTKKEMLILRLSGYLVFLFLFITQPLGYNPIKALILIFIVFALIFLYLSGVSTRVYIRVLSMLPKRIQKMINWFFDKIEISIRYLYIWYLGWVSHELWIESAKEPQVLIFLVGAPLVVFIILPDFDLKKSLKQWYASI